MAQTTGRSTQPSPATPRQARSRNTLRGLRLLGKCICHTPGAVAGFVSVFAAVAVAGGWIITAPASARSLRGWIAGPGSSIGPVGEVLLQWVSIFWVLGLLALALSVLTGGRGPGFIFADSADGGGGIPVSSSFLFISASVSLIWAVHPLVEGTVTISGILERYERETLVSAGAGGCLFVVGLLLAAYYGYKLDGFD